jgi:hypothetical protein
MPGQPAVLLLDDGRSRDVFELVSLDDGVIRARSAFLFEVGEELQLRIEQDGVVREVTARVRAHTASLAGEPRLTELELIS